MATTAIDVLIDRERRLITYSSAGHPPPILLHAEGSCTLLDQATDPPLGARPATHPFPIMPGSAVHPGRRPGALHVSEVHRPDPHGMTGPRQEWLGFPCSSPAPDAEEFP
ncbi:SpoIIE family protein phosphatase [Actinacidiphila soli]|uniref:SpoIIE family protein phosphatase n=1 Tax=Actinacidiphila soli TaxID=2487275 RepID=UPI002B002F5C|nr:SpoIIE family protein phosphatase [Actinacidiphila soli]